MTKPLSPAAQAVMDQFVMGACGETYDIRAGVAAALRTAADQVVPQQFEPPTGESEPWPRDYQLMSDSKWEQRQHIRAELLSIADELEGKADGSGPQPIPPPAPTGDPVAASAHAAIASILAQREEILAAFVAKYGADPDHVEQVEQHMPNGSIRWFVRLKTTAGLQLVLAPTGDPVAAPAEPSEEPGVERLLSEIEHLKQIIKAKDAQIRQAYGYGNDAGSPPWMQ